MSTEILIPLSYSDNPNYNGIIKSVIIAGNGTFEYEKTWIGERLVQENKYTVNPNLPHLSTSFKFDENLPKLPLEAFELMLAFYKGIYDKFETEAQINFYYNVDNLNEIVVNNEVLKLSEISCLKNWGNQLISYVPVQKNSGGLTTTSDPIYEALRQQMKPYIETHSHNTMSAFRSGTDEDNSFYDGLQLVIGHITSDYYDFHNWVTIGGKQYENLELDIVRQIVELPDEFKNKSMDELPDVPEEYYNQHSTYKYIKPKYSSKYNNEAYDALLLEEFDDVSKDDNIYDEFDNAFDFDDYYYARRANKLNSIKHNRTNQTKIVKTFDPVSKTWVENTSQPKQFNTSVAIKPKMSFTESAQKQDHNSQKIGRLSRIKDDVASFIKLILKKRK